MDYAFLKETALKQIQDLVGEKWTDHNVHDPGIALFEILNFSLTDLGYRTDYSIPNILTKEDKNGVLPNDNAFYTAAEILPSAPLTIADYKKLLLNIDEVRNAWIEVVKNEKTTILVNKKAIVSTTCPIVEKPILDKKNRRAIKMLPSEYMKGNSEDMMPRDSYEADFMMMRSTAYKANYIENVVPEVVVEDETIEKEMFFNGLYEILLEFEDDEVLGDLNSGSISWDFEIEVVENPPEHNKRTVSKGGCIDDPDDATISRVDCSLDLRFPYWEETCEAWKEDTNAKLVSSKVTKLVDPEHFNYLFELEYSLDDNPSLIHELCVYVFVHDKTTLDEVVGSDILLEKIKEQLHKTVEISPIEAFRRKFRKILSIVDEVKRTLHENRNLCEDFHCLKSTRIQEILVKAELEFEIGADTEEVLANIYFEIHKFLSPVYKFDLLSKVEDVDSDLLFEGPYLEHGTVDLSDKSASQNMSVIHTSDISKLITKVEGVVAASGIGISAYVNKKLVTQVEANSLILIAPKVYKPQLKIDTLELTPNIESKEQKNYDRDLVREKLKAKIAKETKGRLETDHEEYDLPVPPGEFQDISNYNSIQNLFPNNYGIGEAGLPFSADNERKAQAKQYKAYLLFFEQVLTNHLSQLANVSELFSISPEITETYFIQTLLQEDDVLNLNELFIEDPEYVYDCSNPKNSKKRIVRKEYLATIKAEIETKEIFEERRNRFLDHLMGRFSEDFVDYSLIERGIERVKNPGSKEDPISTQLIGDKINLLDKYPVISRDRGTAFNYLAKIDEEGKEEINYEDMEPDMWNTENVSGFQKRVCALLGIKNHQRRGLSGRANRNYPAYGLDHVLFRYFEIYQEDDNDNLIEHRFRLKDKDGNILISSTLHYHSRSEMYDEIEAVLKFGVNEKNFVIKKTKPTKNVKHEFHYNLLDDTGETIARRIDTFETEEEAYSEMLKTLALIKDVVEKRKHYYEVEQYTGEGFYLIESILLRPKAAAVIDPKGYETFEGTEDPFSFKVRLVFPCQSGRFTDEKFQDFAEQIVREELPAHIIPEFNWVEIDYNMVLFEKAYKNWLMINSIEKPYEKKAIKEWKENWEGAVTALNSAFYGLTVNKGIRHPEVKAPNDDDKIQNMTIIKDLEEYEKDDFVVSEYIYENEGIGAMEIIPEDDGEGGEETKNDFKVKEDDLHGVGEMEVEKDFKIYK